MSDRRKDLVERQNRLWNRMQELRRVSEDEKRDWTAEERTNYDAAEVELVQVSEDIERLERAAKLEKVDYRDAEAAAAEVEKRPSDEQRAAAYGEAFGLYMRGGMERLDGEQKRMLQANQSEIRAQGIATGAAGGFLVPPGFRQTMQETMLAFGGIINHANVISTSSGQPLQWPTNNDTGNAGAILAENTAMTQQDVTIGTRTLGAYVYTSKLVLVSYQLLDDSAFNLDTWLPGKLGERIGRATATHLVSGTGTAQPEGIATNATAGKTGATGQTLTVTYDDLIDLEHSIDPAYRVSTKTRYVMNDATLKVIRKLKDTQNRPLWVPVPTVGMAATINGWPYTIDQAMPAPAANAKSILFGDFNAGFIVRQVQDVQMVRMSERFADALQVGFFGFSRLDAKPDDGSAVRAYVHSAT